MKRIFSLLFSLFFFFTGFGLLKLSIPLFEINQTLTTKKILVDSGIDFDAGGVFVSEVDSNSPASKKGVEKNSQITKINGVAVKSRLEFIETINKKLGSPIILTICKNNSCDKVKIIPREEFPEDQGPLGLKLLDISLLNETKPKLIFDQIYSAYTGQDVYSVIFGKRTLVLRYSSLFVGATFLFFSLKLMKSALHKEK